MNEKQSHGPTISQAQEDYLKIILELINSRRVARIKEIAQRKNVSMPTVTEAMRKMAQDGLINYSAHEFIDLTSEGEQAAHQMTAQHKFLRLFLEDILNIPSETADTEACLLEHHLSPITLERMILLYQFLVNCPHHDSNLIEDFRQCLSAEKLADKTSCRDCFVKIAFPHTVTNPFAVHSLLANLSEGQKGTVTMLGGNTAMRHKLIEQGLVPGATVQMERTGNKSQPFVISVNGLQIKLDIEQANLIEVAISSGEI